ncbi:MAG: glycosyltransferase [Acidobacteriota bacterium]|nr:MAG: glycosyltransferase [Acidobacteriota bacterium]
MKVGLIVYGDLGLVSGGNLYDQMLVEHLRGRGHGVDIVSLAPGSYGRHLLQNYSPGLCRSLAGAGYDVLISDELVHPSLVRSNERLRRTVSYPLVSIVHHLRSSEDRPPWQNDFYRRVEKRYLESIDAFVFNSHTTRESVEALLHKKTRNVVATPGGDRLAVGISRAEIQQRAGEEGPLRLLFVGNLIPRKRLHVLLDVLGELREAPWQLDIVGSLDMDRVYVRRVRAQIERLALGSKVSPHGTLKGERLAERYRGAQMLVVPSSYEGFGIVYLEAMAFGLPVIAGAAGASDEIVLHESTGFLVPTDDTFTLRLQLERVIGDRALLTRLSVTAFETFRDHATWEQSMASIEALLQELGG